MKTNNKTNDYVRALPPGMFDGMPKTVWASLAISFALLCSDEDFEKAVERISEEWKLLHEGGIVPQRPKAFKV